MIAGRGYNDRPDMATLNAVTIAITQYYLVQYPCQGPATEDGPAKVQLAHMTLIGDITNQDPADTATRAGFDIFELPWKCFMANLRAFKVLSTPRFKKLGGRRVPLATHQRIANSIS
jgi:hypothetical protein